MNGEWLLFKTEHAGNAEPKVDVALLKLAAEVAAGLS